MRRVIKPFFWGLLFLVMMLVIDQFFVQVPAVHPAHEAVRTFYRDFRGRLIDLAFGEKKSAKTSIEAVIDKQQDDAGQTGSVATPSGNLSQPAGEKPKPQAGRYLYSDDKGELHFADSLNEVPEEYRGQAQPMAR